MALGTMSFLIIIWESLSLMMYKCTQLA